MKIHIFNPENDMALANGTPGYTPPANIRAYREANWRLPEMWASPEDIIWDGETHFDNLGIPSCQDFEIAPWGWSPASYNLQVSLTRRCRQTNGSGNYAPYQAVRQQFPYSASWE